MFRSPGQGSLFERLDPDVPPRRMRTDRELAAERIRAIKQYLEWMLNARQGCSASSPALGLPDFNDVAAGSTDLRLRIGEHIQAAIAGFEPRVKQVRVRALTDVDQPAGLHFQLSCLVPLNSEHERIEIDLVLQRQNKMAQVC